MNRNRKLAIATLLIIYLVIAAGAIVRMTGSGMGCPDWPKCFGHLIPPTDESELLWQANTTYERGQVIIRENHLEVALKDFKSAEVYEGSNWENYEKHDYATFNPWHTWIEYINRLLGALAGLSTLLLFLSSWLTRPKRTDLRWLSAILLVGILFQAWLGATVVYSVLNPFRISLHMFMALVLVAILFIYYEKTVERKLFGQSSLLGKYLFAGFVLTLIQILMGTRVRQYVDSSKEQIGSNFFSLQGAETLLFYIHRSFSIVVILFHLWIYNRIRKNHSSLLKTQQIILALIGISVLSGVFMYYFDFPFSTQPIHLVIASILFGFQIYIWLRSYRSANETVN
ncbi:MAG: COX15/CtaA family protein [Flavobacteriaceae bacterium]|nr:COX15/CtaA family protein [Flavobacteriaceae bacterium]